MLKEFFARRKHDYIIGLILAVATLGLRAATSSGPEGRRLWTEFWTYALPVLVFLAVLLLISLLKAPVQIHTELQSQVAALRKELAVAQSDNYELAVERELREALARAECTPGVRQLLERILIHGSAPARLSPFESGVRFDDTPDKPAIMAAVTEQLAAVQIPDTGVGGTGLVALIIPERFVEPMKRILFTN